jgi:hypothetical protein
MEQLGEKEREELLKIIGIKQTKPSLSQLDITDVQEEIEPYNTLELLFKMKLQRVNQENNALKNRILSQNKVQQELIQKNNQLFNSISNLKDLASSLLKDANRTNIKDNILTKTLQQLEFHNTSCINNTIQPINDKNAHIIKNQIERLRVDLKAKLLEYQSLSNKLNELKEKIQKEETNKCIREKNYKEKVTQLNNQLAGAVRRINYLISEKHKEHNNTHNSYIVKLEMKCKEVAEDYWKEDTTMEYKSECNVKNPLKTNRNSSNKLLLRRQSNKHLKDTI